MRNEMSAKLLVSFAIANFLPIFSRISPTKKCKGCEEGIRHYLMMLCAIKRGLLFLALRSQHNNPKKRKLRSSRCCIRAVAAAAAVACGNECSGGHRHPTVQAANVLICRAPTLPTHAINVDKLIGGMCTVIQYTNLCACTVPLKMQLLNSADVLLLQVRP